MSRFKLLYFVIFIINLSRIDAQISDKRLCVDSECKVPISHARTLLRYSSPDSRILSFAPNAHITIYSKSAGSREDLWGGEINGKRGYIPKHMVRETKILQKPTLLVDTEFSNDTESKEVPSQLEPDKVQEPYEVVDGTTIFLNPQDTIDPSATESPIQATALPENQAATDNTNTEASQNQAEERNKSEATNQNKEEEDDDDDSEDDPFDDEEDEDAEEFEAVEDDITIETDTENTKSKDNEAPPETVSEPLPSEVEEPSQESAADKPVIQEETVKEEILTDILQDSSNISTSETTEIPIVESNESIEVTDTKVEETEKKEEVTASNILEETSAKVEELEITTLSPEIEVPQPFDDTLEEPTPNPLETESKTESIIDNLIPLSLPTLGLFANTNANEVSSDNLVNQQNQEETTSDHQNQEDISDTKEDKNIATSDQVNNEAENVTTPNQQSQEEIPDSKVAENVAISNQQYNERENIASSNQQSQEEIPDSKAEEIPDSKAAENVSISNEQYNEEENVTSNQQSQEEISDSKAAEDVAILNQQYNEGENVASPNRQNQKEISDSEAVDNVAVPNKQSQEEIPDSKGAISNQQYNGENLASPNHQNEEEISDSKKLEDVTILDQPGQEEISVPQDATTQNKQHEDDTSHLEESPNDFAFAEEANGKSEESGFFSGFMSLFGGRFEEEERVENQGEKIEQLTNHDMSKDSTEQFCDATSCPKTENEGFAPSMDVFSFNSDILLYLVTTAVSVIIFLFGYIAFDKSKREGPLIARINSMEKELLILVKENQILQEKIAGDSGYDTNDRVSSEVVENLKQDLYELTIAKNALEEQVQSLEKELENSTEVGMELNRMLSEILSSESGSDVLRANVEHLQRQLVEQQSTINSVNETLAITNTENHELKLELELSNKKVIDLQAELDKLLLNVLKIEEEKDTQQTSLENEITTYKQKYEETCNKLKTKEEEYSNEIKQTRNRLEQTERNLQLKIKENDVLTDSFKQLKAMKTNDGPTLQRLLDVSKMKAELQLLKSENAKFVEKLQQESEAKLHFEKQAQAAMEEAQRLKGKYDEADKMKVETETKLEVLSSYFKEKEAQLQKEIAKHESLWVEKQGEATSTTERIKFMQEQLQNYKAQTESLKQEIVSQEVELKSQISVLEKKAHENWVSARQAERKIEEAKQEAAQLRHRLTLRERAIQEDKNQHRYQSPIEQNGDVPLSPLDTSASPPLLYGTRDHITKSPPIPGLPPFLPPPPGVPFMPPPLHGVPPFIPPPPNMFPGDHRPPPLGRMSSPPLNSRYSPSSRGYSPYDSSPSDSEYGTSPPQRRGYSPFNSRMEERRDYKRPPPGRSNGRNVLKDGGSSGSGHSQESLDKVNRQQSKV